MIPRLPLFLALALPVGARAQDSWSSAYDSWSKTQLAGVATSLRASQADADQDRLSNFQEFALGTNPASPTRPTAFQRQYLIEREGRHYPAFAYQRRHDSKELGLRFRVQSSRDLKLWTDAEVAPEPGYPVRSLADGLVDEDRLVLRKPLEESGPVFVRLLIGGLTAAGLETPWPAAFDLKTLDGKNGFTVFGDDEDGHMGGAIAGLGDVNGDGLADFAAGARNVDGNGDDSGAVYVIFGGKSPAASLLVNKLDGTNGFTIVGGAAEDLLGTVASAGDINGDGIKDIVLASPMADLGGKNSGAAYVIYGRKTAFPARLRTDEIRDATGFSLIGGEEWDRAGISVAGIGDVNGDGVQDLAVGADLADPNQPRSGKCYVLFGSKAAFPNAINLESLNGTNGFILNGSGLDEFAGRDIAGAGDFNGDGVDDFVVGTADRRQHSFELHEQYVYVVFGRKTAFPARSELSSLDAGTGFKFSFLTRANEYSGVSLAGGGDFNGDGISDIAIGNPEAGDEPKARGGVFLLFGSKNKLPAVMRAEDTIPLEIRYIDGLDQEDSAGSDVDFLGDLNGDGTSELLIGAMQANALEGNLKTTNSGEAYLVFGSKTPPAVISLAGLDGNKGFKINPIDEDGFVGRSVARAGDLNGDGVADFLLGGHRVDYDPNNDGTNDLDQAGAVYVIFGRK